MYYIQLNDYRLSYHYNYTDLNSSEFASDSDAADRCNELCMEASECAASSFSTKYPTYYTCLFFKNISSTNLHRYVEKSGWTSFVKTSHFKRKNDYKEFKGFRLYDHYREFYIVEKEVANQPLKCFEHCIQDSECVGSSLLPIWYVATCHLYHHVNSYKKEQENWITHVKNTHAKYILRLKYIKSLILSLFRILYSPTKLLIEKYLI